MRPLVCSCVMAKVCTGAPTESCCYRSSWQPTAALATSPTPALWPAAMHRSWRTSWVSRVLPPAWHPLGNPMSGSPLSCHSHQPGRTAIAALHGQLALRADPVGFCLLRLARGFVLGLRADASPCGAGCFITQVVLRCDVGGAPQSACARILRARNFLVSHFLVFGRGGLFSQQHEHSVCVLLPPSASRNTSMMRLTCT